MTYRVRDHIRFLSKEYRGLSFNSEGTQNVIRRSRVVKVWFDDMLPSGAPCGQKGPFPVALRDLNDFIDAHFAHWGSEPVGEFSSSPVGKGDWLTFYGEAERKGRAGAVWRAASVHLPRSTSPATLRRLGRVLGNVAGV